MVAPPPLFCAMLSTVWCVYPAILEKKKKSLRKPFEIDSAFAALKDSNWEIREQAVLAIGRIGRADINTVKNRLDKIIQLHCDSVPKVRAAMLDACQSIANAKASVFKPYIGLFERMLDDPDKQGVREHAPDIFRIIGKYEPEMVERSLVLLKEKLRDPSPTTQARAVEAIRTIETFLRRTPTVWFTASISDSFFGSPAEFALCWMGNEADTSISNAFANRRYRC